MAKTVSLDNSAYGQLVILGGNLTVLAEKNFSIGDTSGLAIGVFSKILSKMSAAQKEILKGKLRQVDLSEHEKLAEIFVKAITEETKK